MSIGDQIREARQAAGLTQVALAQATGINVQQIQRYERGHSEPPPDVEARLGSFFEATFSQGGGDDDVSAPPPDEEYSRDTRPTPRKNAGKTKRAPKRAPSTAIVPLSVQLELPYRLLSDVTRNQLPVTSQVLRQQAGPCAEAWDLFLMRYPALREKIEQGMIAADVVALIMAHLPILQAAREEIAARAQAQREAGYAGGVDQAA